MPPRKSRLSVLAPFVAGCAFIAAAAGAGAQTACPTPSATTNPQPVAVQAPKATLSLRVADTVETREYGLMCVRELAPDAGMIFVFGDGDQRRSFWMKNTLISLDMVFVRKNGRVDSVAANVPAQTVNTPELALPWRYGVGTYVIELAGGEAAKAGIAAGAHLDVSHVGPAKN